MTAGLREAPAVAVIWKWCRVGMAHPRAGGGAPARHKKGRHMLRKRMKQGLTVLALGTMLVMGLASCALQGHGRDWTWGQVDAYEHIPIDSGTQGD